MSDPQATPQPPSAIETLLARTHAAVEAGNVVETDSVGVEQGTSFEQIAARGGLLMGVKVSLGTIRLSAAGDLGAAHLLDAKGPQFGAVHGQQTAQVSELRWARALCRWHQRQRHRICGGPRTGFDARGQAGAHQAGHENQMGLCSRSSPAGRTGRQGACGGRAVRVHRSVAHAVGPDNRGLPRRRNDGSARTGGRRGCADDARRRAMPAFAEKPEEASCPRQAARRSKKLARAWASCFARNLPTPKRRRNRNSLWPRSYSNRPKPRRTIRPRSTCCSTKLANWPCRWAIPR